MPIGRSLNSDVNIALADDGGGASFVFRVVAVYAPNIAVERVSFFLAVSAVPRRSETDWGIGMRSLIPR